MTEAATEAKQEAPTIDVKPLIEANPMVKLVFEDLTNRVGQHNEKATAHALASGSVEDAVKAIIADYASANDPKVTKAGDKVSDLREKLTQAEAELNEAATAIATKKVEANSGNAEQLAGEVSKLATDIRDSLKLFRSILSNQHDAPTVDAIIGSLPALTGKRGTKSGKTGGGSGWRIRGFDFYDADGNLLTVKADLKRKVEGKDVVLKDQPVSNTAAVMVYTGAGAEDVRNAFAEAQGTTDSDGFKPEVTFTVLGKDNKSYTIKAKKNVEASADEAAANGADVKPAS